MDTRHCPVQQVRKTFSVVVKEGTSEMSPDKIKMESGKLQTSNFSFTEPISLNEVDEQIDV